ncbi:MAG: hypothetical protein HW389_2683, partial [Bacteroidetes bacterium]|nr:hypothetical protein [Bacteroidota bacterium]
SNQPSVISVQLADESSKHFLHFDCVVGQLLGINLLKHLQIGCEQNKILEFAG